MHARRLTLAVSAAVFLVAGISVAVPADAGVQAPHDMVASPNTGPVGTHVTISNAKNSPCGGQDGDGPAQVDVLVTQPNGDDANASVAPDLDGNWELVYFDTAQVGTYTAVADCIDAPTDLVTRATDFGYTPVTFVITADEPTTTAAPTTTSTAAPAAAVAATAAFTG